MVMAENQYPYPAMLNISNFVTIKLSDSSNYSLWKAQMLCLLESQELVGFIDGTVQPPLKMSNKDNLAWKRTDRLVKGWFLGSLTEEMLHNVAESVTARDVWLELEEICQDEFEAEGRKMQPIIEEAENMEPKEDYKYYLPLYRASLCGNWEEANAFLKKDNEATGAQITSLAQTALHIAIGSKNTNAKSFIENLVASMTDDALALKDCFGETALHYAAQFGNLDAAKILVNRNSDLPHVASENGLYPIHLAVEYGYKYVDLVDYFFSVTKSSTPCSGRTGVRLLCRLISSDLYDFATHLINSFPDLVNYSSNGSSPLALLATKASIFIGTSHPCSCKTLPSIVARTTSWIFQSKANVNDIENAVNEALLEKPTSKSPELEYIRDKEWKNQNAVKLVECLCEKLESLSEEEIKSIVGGPLLQAAQFDNLKFVEIIVRRFPSLVYYCNKNGKNILLVAVTNRCRNVFNLVGQMSHQHKHHLMTSVDSTNNTMLHLAGKLSPENKLNRTIGAALQLHEELRWFEAVKQWLPSSHHERLNNQGKTAQKVFTEEHADLKARGEKWMKETANLCAIIAMLIVTIAFAATITVPGGRNCDNGLPNFSKNGFLSAFAFSNTVSLSTSCISLFAFISILTSRYAEEDFLRVLPKRLLWGLVTQYASIEAMMLSFGCALYFVLNGKEMFYAGFVLAVLPILAFQHWRGALINYLFFLVIKRKGNSLVA